MRLPWHTLQHYWALWQQHRRAHRALARRHSTAAQQLGDAMEARALAHLQAAGLRLLARNYRCRYGEVDLILQSERKIVFVEVRARTSSPTRTRFGAAAASISARKQERLWRTAQHYLARQRLQLPCRFDAVLIDDGQLVWLTDTMRR